MNTSANRFLLMSSSAALLALLGVGATFFPQEILAASGAQAGGASAILVQLLGALSVSFATVNWMGRTNLIGGVYSRPVAMGNTLHFTMGALALLKSATAGAPGPAQLVLLGLYALFALAFSLILFTHPAPDPS